jgi:hypothetical protein
MIFNFQYTRVSSGSMKTYFLERCTGGAKNVNFWKTVKPFFSKKCNSGDQNIILCEDNKIINDTCEVSEKFNIGNKTYVFCIWLLLIHCSYMEVDFYGVVYFSLERIYQVHF